MAWQQYGNHENGGVANTRSNVGKHNESMAAKPANDQRENQPKGIS
jgi:DMSO/TMAO reductase YedYZ molybdopterin-dependent catalytic subunit